MAVVQISRITHRSGVSENLPQLARGEIGLAVDTRQLYIGNGGANAPTTENLEILTNRSDIIILADTYTYSDAQIGFSAQTGTSASIPIARSLQNKLDDFASVRDFGAIGDGATDDTDAINRALYELFTRETIFNYTSDPYAKNDHKYSKEMQEIRKELRKLDKRTKKDGGVIDWNYMLNDMM